MREKSNPNSTITFEFTKDTMLIEQYSKLRSELYEKDNKFKGFRIFSHLEQEIYNDPNIDMLVAMDKNQCIGGAQLTICKTDAEILLPLEQDIIVNNQTKFLKNNFPAMNLNHCNYGEFNRIVLRPEYRSGYYVKQIFGKILEKSLEYNVKYLFGMGDIVRARLYRRLYKAFNLDVVIYNDIQVPNKLDYEGLRMYLMSMDITRAKYKG